jgi:predicted PurR-regulated permease PerM
LESWCNRREISAAIAVITVAICIIAPAFFIVTEVYKRTLAGVLLLRNGIPQQVISEFLGRHPMISSGMANLVDEANFGQTTKDLAGYAASHLAAILSNSVGAIVQIALMVFILFFLYRDYEAALAAGRSILPLADDEVNLLYRRCADTLYATTLGRSIVASVQGVLATIAFWTLGVNAPPMWGLLTFAAALVPAVGAFLVWAPIALYLGLSGHWQKALILALWGGLVVSTIDNFLYPALVGPRISQHTVLVLISVLGGVALFGVSGLVLGPVLLTLGKGLLEIWKDRTSPSSEAS